MLWLLSLTPATIENCFKRNTKTWFLGRVYRMHKKITNKWVEYRVPIDSMDQPSHMEIG